MNNEEVIKIPNPETRLSIIRRYMHVLALLQKPDDNNQWNAGTLADLLSMEEEVDGGLSDKLIRDYIKQFLIEELGFDIKTTKGSRRTVLETPIPRHLLEKIASVYLSFTAIDASRDLVLKRLIDKHPEDSLWLLARIHFAILQKNKITFNYVKHLASENEPKQYILHPYHIILRNNNLYLVGKSGRSGHIVLFIVNKITDLNVLQETYDEEVIEASEFFKDSLGCYIGKKFNVKIRIDREAFRQVDEIISSLEPDYTEADEGKTVIAGFNVSDDTYLCKQLFTFGSSVEILEPETLRKTMVKLLKEGLKQYSR